ncbi:MAG TPA: dTDP-4-dehydrorhamnose reductase [Kiritimatiellia bacterium]|nr:dTDP-4-dehydrorhamnose reductase [Kiritimatiellia bacterium]HPS06856.1 dTDP-4-dehydrorhamnose reductase [Kiritimatiellia bacterium]
MKLLLTGGKGMLGRTLQRHLRHHELFVVDLPEVDITDGRGVEQAVNAFRPEVVIHAAAMTQVDACESDADKAYRINALGSAYVARAAARCGARLIALSTDYVFDGCLSRPYHEYDAPAPRTVYGASKLAGEEAVRRHCPDHTILRIAWLYGEEGPSFLHTLMKLGAQAGEPLKVVDDQRGNPTSTDAAAELIARLLETPVPGVVHGSCEGEATWFEFAQAIFKRAGLSRGLMPCTTAEFPRPAPRPANSRLEKRVLRLAGLPPMPHWEEALEKFVRA